MTLGELLSEEDPAVVAAVLWLATCDGYKIHKHLARETLHAVHADLVRAGQLKEAKRATDRAGDEKAPAGR